MPVLFPYMRQILSILPLLTFLLLLIYIAWNVPNFLSLSTLSLILVQASPILILCLGLSAVVIVGGEDIVSGGIDLSLPATAVFAAGTMAYVLSRLEGSLFLAFLAGLIAALGIGALNAILVSGIGLTPLLATLATFVATVGFADFVTDNRRINVNHPFIIGLRDGTIFGVPWSLFGALLIATLISFLIHATPWGRHLQAVGGGRDAAKLARIKIRPKVIGAFMIAAACAFITAFYVLARGSGYSPGVQDTLLVEMVLATFLGATFSPRRVVTVWGAALGAVLVAAMDLGFKSMGVNIFWTGLIKGSLILFVVSLSAVSRQRG